MSQPMRLSLYGLDHLLVQAEDVCRIDAEDISGHFALAPGHADFIALLVPSIVKWICQSGAVQYAAVADAVLYAEAGQVQIFAREAAIGDHPAALLGQVQTTRRRRILDAQSAQRSAAALDEAARRHISAMSRAQP
jgi:F-type H+-transporting ATPase subunit epsilon